MSTTQPQQQEMAPEQQQIRGPTEYLNEYDYYYFEQEKYINAGHGGKQRNKREIVLNQSKRDPCGDVRIVTKRMQNFQQKRKNMNLSKSQ